MEAAHPRALLLALLAAAAPLAGCGSGHSYHDHYDPPAPVLGEVDVYNNTPDEVLTWFGLALAGTGEFSGDLVPDLYPGEVAYAGAFYEDYYDAEADVEDPFGFVSTVYFYDVFVEAGFVTEFEVF